MKRKFIVFISSPFVALGFVWQFVAGGFEAGRMLATAWVHDEALRILQSQLAAAARASGNPNSKLN